MEEGEAKYNFDYLEISLERTKFLSPFFYI